MKLLLSYLILIIIVIIGLILYMSGFSLIDWKIWTIIILILLATNLAAEAGRREK
jgi:hypothetical protein